jgi:ABC-2 type transport system ATP-binding protein
VSGNREIDMTIEQAPDETGAVSMDRANALPASESKVPAIEITNLVKTYGKRPSVSTSVDVSGYLATIRGKASGTVTALNGIDLQVPHGEVFGLLGPNGAGKTTLIKILSTLVLPDAGKALVYGVDVAKKPRTALRLLQTVLAQSSGFEIRLSGRRNLELYAALYGIPKEAAKRKIDYLLDFTRLTDRADAPFQMYSTGMARKLLVCRALLSNASLLIFDEPTSSLDPVSAMEFRKFIQKDLVEEGKTIFLATHNLHEAQQICNRIALIEKGKIIAVGTPSQIRTRVSDRTNLLAFLSGLQDSRMSDLRQELKKVDGVIDVEMQPAGDGVSLRIVGERQVDYNRIFDLLLRMNLRIGSLEATEPSLEEAFLSLMNRDEK